VNSTILLSPIHSSLHYKTHTITYNYTHFNKSLQYIHINRNYRVHNGFTTKADNSALHFNSQQPTANSRCNCYTNYKLCFTQSVSITGL